MQQTRSQTPVGRLWNSIQSWLFPVLEDEIGALDLSACGTHRQAAGREPPFVADVLKALFLLARPVFVTVQIARLEVEQALDGVAHGRSDGNGSSADVQRRSD